MSKKRLQPCPHCNATATYTTIFTTLPERLVDLQMGEMYYALVTCDAENCGRVVFLIFKGLETKEGRYTHFDIELVDQYPKRIPKLHKSIPRQVTDDYIEAIKCFDVGAWKASVVICRRALQVSVIEKGAKKGILWEQIDELYDGEIITKDIKDWAHEIRLTGNIGAHPDKDGLEDVTKEDAKELIDFMEEYLNYVYIMPSKVQAKRAKKEEAKSIPTQNE